MPDLHGWITQQVDHTAAIATEATPGPWHVTEYNHDPDFDAGIGTTPGSVDVVGHGYEGGGVERREDARHVVIHDPAAVLRRCEADRRILARHHLDPDTYWSERAMCQGCGTEGEMSDPVTENLNDCPELLDLGYAHGLTDKILASLDRPKQGERPAPSGPGLFSDEIMNAYSKAITEMILDARPIEPRLTVKLVGPAPMPGWLREDLGLPAPAPAPEPTPQEKALDILGPELKKIPGYVPAVRDLDVPS